MRIASPEIAVERFLLGSELYADQDFEEAADCFLQVMDYLEREEITEIDSDHGTLLENMPLKNLCLCYQNLKDFGAMKKWTSRLINSSDPSASDLVLHAIALHHTGLLTEALSFCDSAIAKAPTLSSAYHERACVFIALGKKSEALSDVQKAIENGSRPGDLSQDPDLKTLFTSENFQKLMDPLPWISALNQRFQDMSREIQPLNSRKDLDGMIDFDFESAEKAVALLAELLEAVQMDQAPKRQSADGLEWVDGVRCNSNQQLVLRSILGATSLWQTIPFLNLLGRYQIPNGFHSEAERELFS